MNNKPRHLLPFKIAGIIGVIAIVTGIVLVVTGFGDFESNRFMIGSFVAVGGVMLTAIGITVGFAPEIAKARAKTVRYICSREHLSAEFTEVIPRITAKPGVRHMQPSFRIITAELTL